MANEPSKKETAYEFQEASQGGYVEIIIDLLEAGANPTITVMCGERPIDQALPRKKEAVRNVFDRYRRW